MPKGPNRAEIGAGSGAVEARFTPLATVERGRDGSQGTGSPPRTAQPGHLGALEGLVVPSAGARTGSMALPTPSSGLKWGEAGVEGAGRAPVQVGRGRLAGGGGGGGGEGEIWDSDVGPARGGPPS